MSDEEHPHINCKDPKRTRNRGLIFLAVVLGVNLAVKVFVLFHR